jgi:hypothetical protein
MLRAWNGQCVMWQQDLLPNLVKDDLWLELKEKLTLILHSHECCNECWNTTHALHTRTDNDLTITSQMSLEKNQHYKHSYTFSIYPDLSTGLCCLEKLKLIRTQLGELVHVEVFLHQNDSGKDRVSTDELPHVRSPV